MPRAGLEPATCRLEGGRSIHLSYRDCDYRISGPVCIRAFATHGLRSSHVVPAANREVNKSHEMNEPVVGSECPHRLAAGARYFFLVQVPLFSLMNSPAFALARFSAPAFWPSLAMEVS